MLNRLVLWRFPFSFLLIVEVSASENYLFEVLDRSIAIIIIDLPLISLTLWHDERRNTNQTC